MTRLSRTTSWTCSPADSPIRIPVPAKSANSTLYGPCAASMMRITCASVYYRSFGFVGRPRSTSSSHVSHHPSDHQLRTSITFAIDFRESLYLLIHRRWAFSLERLTREVGDELLDLAIADVVDKLRPSPS